MALHRETVESQVTSNTVSHNVTLPRYASCGCWLLGTPKVLTRQRRLKHWRESPLTTYSNPKPISGNFLIALV